MPIQEPRQGDSGPLNRVSICRVYVIYFVWNYIYPVQRLSTNVSCDQCQSIRSSLTYGRPLVIGITRAGTHVQSIIEPLWPRDQPDSSVIVDLREGADITGDHRY